MPRVMEREWIYVTRPAGADYYLSFNVFAKDKNDAVLKMMKEIRDGGVEPPDVRDLMWEIHLSFDDIVEG
jgi:hypothetical protein